MLNGIGVVVSLIICLVFLFNVLLVRPDDFSEQAESLKLLKENWHGCYAEFESTMNNGDPGTKPIQMKFWVSRDGGVFRFNSIHEYLTSKGTAARSDAWRLYCEDFVFSRDEIRFGEEGKPKVHVSARVVGASSPMAGRFAFEPFQTFFGFDRFSDCYWYEILENPDANVSVTKSPEGVEVIAKHLDYGTYKFDFTKVADRWLLQSVVCKRKNVPPDPEMHDIISYSFEAKNITYKKLGDRYFIDSIGYLHKKSMSKNGRSTDASFSQEVKSLSTNNELRHATIEFPGVAIPDGTVVRVANDRGIPYEIHAGSLVKVVDPSVIVTAENARFRKPPGPSWTYYAGLGLLIAAVLGAIAYWRRR